MDKKTILIIEDDSSILKLINDYAKTYNFNPILAENGQKGLDIFKNNKIDLVILDLMLPKIDGFDICKTIRKESNIPIIILSAKTHESDKILGLGLGADDYVSKPFSPKELMARVKSQFEREKRIKQKDLPKKIIVGPININQLSKTVKLDGKKIDFSKKEYDILLYLIKHKNQVLSRKQIFNTIWGYDNYGDINTVTVHITKIRKKLEKDPENPKFIKTIWGIGYKFKEGHNE